MGFKYLGGVSYTHSWKRGYLSNPAPIRLWKVNFFICLFGKSIIYIMNAMNTVNIMMIMNVYESIWIIWWLWTL